MCDESVKEFDGKRIFCRHWKVEGDDPKCLVFISHGFAEHCGRYDETVAMLNKQNIFVFSHDHVGHGRSSGARAWVNHYDEFCGPIRMHIEEVAAKYTGKKIFIYGFSMGGLISARLATRFPGLVHGYIMEGPFLGLPEFISSWQIKIGLMLGRNRCLKYLPVGKGDTSLISHDQALVKSFKDDPLNYHGAIKARWTAAAWDAWEDLFANTRSFQTPVLICHGDDDKLCPISGSEKLYKQIASPDKTFKVFSEARHYLHGETHKDIKTEFHTTIADWINTRC